MLTQRTLDRLRKGFWHLWLVLKELKSSPDPDALLESWRRAQKPSRGWRRAQEYEWTLNVLSIALRLPRSEAEREIWEYINEERQPAPTQRDEVGV